MSVKFEIYRDGERVSAFAPVAATAMGAESVPQTGEVSFRDGVLTVHRPDDHATGVSLLWDVGPLGAYQLETTRLPPRDKPYVLNVELARFRLMKIMQKQEDWNLFDFPRADKFTARFREAQAVLADALGKLDTPADAAKLADQALAIGIDLSEQLGAFHGELLINRRRAGNTFVKHIFGSRVDSSVQNAKYKDALAGSFDYAVLPMSWKQIQPEEGAFNTEAIDEWVETLTRRRIPIIAGPLIDFNEGQVPDWLFIWEHDFDTLREMAYEFVQKVVHRYRKAVAVWNVCSGLHTNRALTLTFEQIIELTRLLVAHVKNMLPTARALITVSQPYGEYHARSNSIVPPMMYAEMVAQSGINFEAFGLEIEQGVPTGGRYTRDLFQLSCMLDKFSTLGKPLFLTAVGAPGRPGPDSSDASGGRVDPSAAGRWRRPWDAQLQAEWMEGAYKTALSKPFVESIAWANLADIGHTLPGGGLFDDMLQPKPVFERLQKMRDVFHGWTGRKPQPPTSGNGGPAPQ
ncbi:MAG: endo-1,4-beta-xylanase [Phycisphaerae bacterium]|nr:endo-1,4-beta-xylanase [Tepidisphaeraceae bacterium]